MQKKIILNLTPQSHCRATKGDAIFFRIPRQNLKPSGLRRLLRLEKYNNYKIELLAEAKRNRFVLPPYGLHVTFYLPTPKSWSKKKRKEYHGTLCQNRPDIDNLIKSFCDSLTSEDKFVANIAATKRWADFDTGWIECTQIDEPLKVLVCPPVKE